MTELRFFSWRPAAAKLAFTGVLATVGLVRDAGACSCALRPTVLSPLGASAPLTSRVRVTGIAADEEVVLRARSGAEIPARRTPSSEAGLGIVEIAPLAPLDPNTSYTVGVVQRVEHFVPTVRVFGTFLTGANRDDRAPTFGMGKVTVDGPSRRTPRSSCDVDTPWVTVHDVTSDDPERPAASLLYAVWIGAQGTAADTTKPPTRLVPAHEGLLRIGAASTCSPSFPLPSRGRASLAVAAVDESGNTSEPRRFSVVLGP